MAQGLKKISKGAAVKSNGNKNSAKVIKQKQNAAKVRIGNPVKPSKKPTFDELEEKTLTRAIDRANEGKVAAKLLQGGGKIGLIDIMKSGKDINRETRRQMVKKKETRVEEKLRELTEKAENEGLVDE